MLSCAVCTVECWKKLIIYLLPFTYIPTKQGVVCAQGSDQVDSRPSSFTHGRPSPKSSASLTCIRIQADTNSANCKLSVYPGMVTNAFFFFFSLFLVWNQFGEGPPLQSSRTPTCVTSPAQAVKNLTVECACPWIMVKIPVTSQQMPKISIRYGGDGGLTCYGFHLSTRLSHTAWLASLVQARQYFFQPCWLRQWYSS